ncbi:hypothetical protein Tco_0370496 [Tanacetum coccineum]
MSLTIQSSVKDKILATSSETSKVENTPAKMLRDLDQQMEKRSDDGKTNVVTNALSMKERVKPRRVRAMAMISQYGVRGMILEAKVRRSSKRTYTQKGFMDVAESVRDMIVFEYCLTSSSGWTNIWCAPFEALYVRKRRSPVLWAEIGESSLIGPELVQEMTDKVVLIKEKLKATRDRQKICADNRRKPLEFEGEMENGGCKTTCGDVKVSLMQGFVVLSTFEELQMLRFFLKMGFTLILATLDVLDVGLLGDVIGEDEL